MVCVAHQNVEEPQAPLHFRLYHVFVHPELHAFFGDHLGGVHAFAFFQDGEGMVLLVKEDELGFRHVEAGLFFAGRVVVLDEIDGLYFIG